MVWWDESAQQKPRSLYPPLIREDRKGARDNQATHVLSLVLSRSSFDSIISERLVFCSLILPSVQLRGPSIATTEGYTYKPERRSMSLFKTRRTTTNTCHACALTAVILVRYLDPTEPIAKDPSLQETAQLMVSRTDSSIVDSSARSEDRHTRKKKKKEKRKGRRGRRGLSRRSDMPRYVDPSLCRFRTMASL